MKRDSSELPALLATDVRHTFRDMVERYQHSLYTFACRLSRSQQDAEDIVQEAFVRAYVALVTYPAARIEALKLRPWLYRITLNEFHHHVRGARLHVVPMDLSDGSPVLEIEGATTQYRVVSERRPSVASGETAQIEPRLEESYVWLMREGRVAESVRTA